MTINTNEGQDLVPENGGDDAKVAIHYVGWIIYNPDDNYREYVSISEEDYREGWTYWDYIKKFKPMIDPDPPNDSIV